METYKKYLPRDKRIDESGVPKRMTRAIDALEEILMDLEVNKNDQDDTALSKSWKAMESAYTKWVQLFRRHAKMDQQTFKS